MAADNVNVAKDMIGLIRDLIIEELNKRDSTEICQIAAVNSDGTYHITIPPDDRNIVRNVVSISPDDLKQGDYAYIYKFLGKLNNAIILTRIGSGTSLRFVTKDELPIQEALYSSGGGGGGGGDSVAWGDITGALANQTDLNTALNARPLRSELATVATSGSYTDLINKPTIPLNIQDGTGAGALQQKQDGNTGTFSFTNKNPNATALDPTLTGDIPFGGVGNFATSFGGKSQASGKRSLAEGTTTIAKGNYSHAEGDNSVAYGHDSHAEGYQTVSYGGASHAEGTSTQALGNNSHAEGNSTIARAVNSHAEGYNSQTLISDSSRPNIPAYSDQQGGGGSDPGQGGTSTAQTGDGAHVEGSNTRAVGNYSHAEGTNTWAGGLSSHAEGYGSQALYDYAHAEGYNSVASGYGAHATGLHTVASGNYSFTQGQQTEAGYNLSSAFGKGTVTSSEAQMVIGKYNSNKSGTLFEVGNGTANNSRSNAFEVRANGNVVVNNGTIVIGNTTLTENQLQRLLALLDSLETIGE